MKVTPFMAFQELVTNVCSLLLHHVVVTAKHDGAIMASKEPSMNLRPRRDLKSVHEDMMASEEPQRKMAAAMTFPLGSLTRIQAATGCMTSWAMYRMEPSQEYCFPTRCASSLMPKMET